MKVQPQVDDKVAKDLSEKPSILIVDDNPKNLKVLQRMLEPQGYKVRPANSGRLALRAASVVQPDLILLDIDMPDMNGYEVCRHLKSSELTCDIPVIFVSALDSIADKIKAFNEGGADYIVKPFQSEEVNARVHNHISLRQARLKLEVAKDEVEQQVLEKTAQLNESLSRFQQLSIRDSTLAKVLQLSIEEFDLSQYLENTLVALLTTGPWLAILRLNDNIGDDSSHYQFREGVIAEMQNGIINMSYRAKNYLTKSNTGSDIIYAQRRHGAKEFSFSPVIEDIKFQDSDCQRLVLQPIVHKRHCLGLLVLVVKNETEVHSSDLSFYRQIGNAVSENLSRRHSEQAIEHMAFHDELTGLPNRRLFEERVLQEINICKRTGSIGAILYLDLDGFKLVNDALGHDVGDRVLQLTANRFRKLLRSTDTCARWGGDEFVILIPGLADDSKSAFERALQVADKLRENIIGTYEISEHEIQLSTSIGISLLGDDRSAQVIMTEADAAMYEAKRSGKNTIRCYKPEYQSFAERRLTLIKGLRNAIEQNEIRLVYQPQVNQDDEIVGVEALMRWNREGEGNIPPDVFIPLAEESRLIVDLGDWALTEACTQLRQWIDSGLIPESFCHVAVNVSPKQFDEKYFVENLQQILTETNISPEFLEIEVTERLMMTRVEEIIAKLLKLKAIGVSFSIDDFGTGYSSLAYLLRLPLDMLKIDRSFVTGVHKNKQAATIVSTIIGMARNLGISTIAEGVEEDAERVYLQNSGCDFFQGFGLYRPMEAEQVTELFNSFYSEKNPTLSKGIMH